MNYAALPDHDLAALLKAGDHAAFTEIYRRFKAPLYVHVYNKLRSTEEARDLVQELFTHLWSGRQSLNFEHNLQAYLYTSARHKVFRAIERLGNSYKMIDSLASSINQRSAATDHRVRTLQLQQMIEREINALPARMREVFYLSRMEHLSHREIALRLDISEPTVKKQVNNALKILRLKLGMLPFLYLLLKIF